MVNNTTGMVQIIATILGLIESTCIMAEVKANFCNSRCYRDEAVSE